MATIYNKTALKKVKKDALIQMFLDLQAQTINDSLDEAVEKCCTNAIEEVVENLKAENEKLKDKLHKNTCDKYWSIEQAEMRLGDVIEKLKEENEKLKKFKSDVIDALQFDDDLDDEDYISSIKEMEEQYDINKD